MSTGPKGGGSATIFLVGAVVSAAIAWVVHTYLDRHATPMMPYLSSESVNDTGAKPVAIPAAQAPAPKTPAAPPQAAETLGAQAPAAPRRTVRRGDRVPAAPAPGNTPTPATNVLPAAEKDKLMERLDQIQEENRAQSRKFLSVFNELLTTLQDHARRLDALERKRSEKPQSERPAGTPEAENADRKPPPPEQAKPSESVSPGAAGTPRTSRYPTPGPAPEATVTADGYAPCGRRVLETAWPASGREVDCHCTNGTRYKGRYDTALRAVSVRTLTDAERSPTTK